MGPDKTKEVLKRDINSNSKHKDGFININRSISPFKELFHFINCKQFLKNSISRTGNRRLETFTNNP